MSFHQEVTSRMFSRKLCLCMLQDLQEHKRDKELVMLDAINNRLSSSFTSYFSDISKSVEYLSTKETKRVIKSITRIYK